MSDRPGYLIIVTHPKQQVGLELFSAHHTEGDAKLMLGRLERLLAPAGSRAHLVAVPEIDGVADIGELPPLPAMTALPDFTGVTVASAPAVKPAPFRRLSQAEFAAETQAQEMNGGIVTDTVAPRYADAIS